MITRFITESGSVYEVDLENRMYRKVETTGRSMVSTFPWTKFLTLQSRRSGGEFVGTEKIVAGKQYRFANFGEWSRTSVVVGVEKVDA